MELQVKDEMQQFLEEFWNTPGNVDHFKMGAERRVESANCRLSRGNVALMSNSIVTRQEMESWRNELCMPVPVFAVDSD
jgi:hypothetical protein